MGKRSLSALSVAVLALWPAAARAASSDWPQYLHGPQHSSMSATTAITTANAGALGQLWHWMPAGVFSMCIASAVWDGPDGALFLAGNQTHISGTAYGGSVREATPSSGAYVWQRGLPCTVMGTPSANAAGLLAVATYNACTPSTAKPAAYLLSAATGSILRTLP